MGLKYCSITARNIMGITWVSSREAATGRTQANRSSRHLPRSEPCGRWGWQGLGEILLFRFVSFHVVWIFFTMASFC